MLEMIDVLTPKIKTYPSFMSHISAAHDIKIFSGIKTGKVQCVLESEICVIKLLSDYKHSKLEFYNEGKTSKYIPFMVIADVEIPFRTCREINEKMYNIIKKMTDLVCKENVHNFFAGMRLLGKDNAKVYIFITTDMKSDEMMHVYVNPSNLKTTPSWIKCLDEKIE